VAKKDVLLLINSQSEGIENNIFFLIKRGIKVLFILYTQVNIKTLLFVLIYYNIERFAYVYYILINKLFYQFVK